MVSSVPSIPGSRNMRIRISVNSPLKKLHRTTTKYDAVIVLPAAKATTSYASGKGELIARKEVDKIKTPY